MNPRHCLLAVALALAAPSAGPAQSVSFEAGRPAPGLLGFDQMWNITLHNSTPDTWTVYFHVEASVAGGEPVFAANSQDLVLVPGDLALTAADVKLTDVWCAKGYSGFATAGKRLPEDDYAYSITFVPSMCTTSFTVQVRRPAPLELVYPPRRGDVADSLPLFAWKAPVVSGSSGEFHYGFRLVEAAAGQSPASALDRNAPVFEEPRLAVTACRLPASAGRLRPGKTYAWRVQARDATKVPVDPVDTAQSLAKTGSFVYRPGTRRPVERATFDYPGSGQPVLGKAAIKVRTEMPRPELCVLEYALGPDTARGDWQTAGCLPQVRGGFVGQWASDSAVTRAGRQFGTPCVLRATVLDSQGRRHEALLKTTISRPPARTRRGCGCGH